MVRVEENEERIAYDAPAMLICFLDLISHQPHGQALGMVRVPVGVCHFGSARSEPVEILHVKAMNRAALEKVAPPKDRILSSQPDEPADESEQLTLLF